MLDRHLRRLLALPGTRLAVIASPATLSEKLFLRWHFWWQAQLLDLLVDAYERSPSGPRAARIRALLRGIRLRNAGRFTNDYHDDIAWLGLALQRAGSVAGRPQVVAGIVARLRAAWQEDELGGLPWRRGDVFRNAPAAGPSAILLARNGFVDEAARLTEWMRSVLRRKDGLVADGIRVGGHLEDTVYTYNQGVLLGADVELVRRGRPGEGNVAELVDAIATGLSTGGVLRGHGGGDGGLFSGILARYLAVVVCDWPDRSAAAEKARSRATELIFASAAAAWEHADPDPHFGADWAHHEASRDLSVQLGGWMLTEAAARVEDRRRRS